MRRFKVLTDNHHVLRQGAVVCEYLGHDYGLCRDDRMATGVEHVAVSRDGKLPFFSVSVDDLEEIKQ